MRVRERELDSGRLDGAALVRVEDVLETLLALQPVGHLDRRDDGAAVLLRELDGVAEMVAVAVGERDHVDPLGLELRLRALRVPVQEGVDVDALPARACRSGRWRGRARSGSFRACVSSLEWTPRAYSGRTVRCGREPYGVGSRLLPLVLATAALAAGVSGLGGLALWLGLLTVPAAAAAAFVAVSDTLEGRPALLQAVTSGVALLLVVVASAARGTPRRDMRRHRSPPGAWCSRCWPTGFRSSPGCSSRCASRSERARSAACGPPRSTSSSPARPRRVWRKSG